MTRHEVVVMGAGPAGLASALSLKDAGLRPLVLDRQQEVAASWRGRYDRLRIEIVRGVDALQQGEVTLADGVRLQPDAVIFATGYRRGLEPLVGHLDVLDARGMPRAVGERPAAPGLRFIGYVSRPGGLGYMGKEARRAAKAIASDLRSTTAQAPENERAAQVA